MRRSELTMAVSLRRCLGCLVLIAHLTQPRVIWEERLNEGSSELGWLVDLSVGDCLDC